MVISLDEQRRKREKRLALDAPSTRSMPSGELGEIPIDPDSDGAPELGLMMLYDVCREAWDKGISTKGDYARKAANALAIAAVEGLITTKMTDVHYGNRWLLTEDGADFMVDLEDAHS